ncbi:uncharacterized protein LOC133549083 [Nerophis ophidion]|uniref:uncharacterized protein LOC133549083 n=1 Tax=Nerophis ophidion TaxID=159077 RepID=UPI002AE08715|nr:uncharacterized protein LOC133549083 [Nerophis ophidion]
MRLTALCVCGTLLAFSSLSWTSLGDTPGTAGLNPCVAALTADGPCGPEQAWCPYVLNLPPLTVHLPEKLRELEAMVKELQILKDDVEELRKMCGDCGGDGHRYVKGGHSEILRDTGGDLGRMYLVGDKKLKCMDTQLSEEVPDSDETKEERIQAGRGIKDHGRHTSRDLGQIWDERRKEMERGTQVQGSNEKPQQPENTEIKSTKEGEESVQREGDGRPGKDFVGISPISVSTSIGKKMEKGRQVQGRNEKLPQPEKTELKSTKEGEESVQREGDGRPGKDTEGTDFVGISPTSASTSTRKKMEKGIQVQRSPEKPQQPENTEIKSTKEGEESVQREGDGQPGKDTEQTDFVGISPISVSTSTRKKEMERGIQVQGRNEKPQQPENTDLKSNKEGEGREKHVQGEGDGQSGKDTDRTDFVRISPTSVSTSTKKKMERGRQVQGSHEKPQQPENTEIKSTKEGEESVQREGDGQPGKDTEQTDFVGISPISVSTSTRKKEMERGIQVQGRNEKPQQPENTDLKSNKEGEGREKHVQGEGDGQSGKDTDRTDFVRISPTSVSTSTKKKMERGRQVQGSHEKPQQPENTEIKSTKEGEESVQREGDGQPGKDTEQTDFVGISPISVSTSTRKKEMERGIQVQGRNEKPQQPENTDLKSNKEGEGREKHVQGEGDGQSGKDTDRTDFVRISPTSVSTSTKKKMERGRQVQGSHEKPQQQENTELKSNEEGEESVQREGDGQSGKDTEGTDFVGISPTSVFTSTGKKMEKGKQVQGSNEKPQQPETTESYEEGEENAEKHVQREGDGQPGKETEGTDFVGISPTSASISTRKKMEKGIQVQRSPEKPQQPENTEIKSTKEGEESVQREGDGQPGKDTEQTDFVGISPISVSTSSRKKEMEKGIQVQGRNEKPQQPENTELKSNKEREEREKHVQGEGDGQSGKGTERTDFVRIGPSSVSTSTKKKVEKGRQVQGSNEKPQQPENTELKSTREGEKSVQREGDGRPGKDTEGTDFVGISPTSASTSIGKKMEKGIQVQGRNEKLPQPDKTELKSTKEGEESVQREGDGQPGKDTEGTDFVGISPISASTSTRKKMEKGRQLQRSPEKPQQPENTELKSTKEGEESVQREGDGQPGKDTEGTDFVGISPTSVSTSTRMKMEKGIQVQGSHEKPQQPGNNESNKEGEENAEKHVQGEGDGQSDKDTEGTDFVGISPTSVSTYIGKKMEKGRQVQGRNEKLPQPDKTELKFTKEGEESVQRKGDGQPGKDTEGTDFVGISPTSASTSTRKKMEKGIQVQRSPEKPQQPENTELKSTKEGEESVQRKGDGQPGKDTERTDFVGISPISVSTSTRKKEMERGIQVQGRNEKPQQPENTDLKSNKEGEGREKHVQGEGDGQSGKDTDRTDFVRISPTSVSTSTKKKMERGRQVQGSHEKPQQPENTEIKSTKEGEESVQREGDGQPGKDTEQTDFVGISPISVSTSTRKKEMERGIQVQGRNEKPQQPENTDLKSNKEGEGREKHVQGEGDGQSGKDTDRTDFVRISPTSVSTSTKKKMERGRQVQGSHEKPQQQENTELKSNEEGEESVQREGDGQSGKDTEGTDFVGISPTSVFTSTGKKMEKGKQVQGSNEKPQQPETTESYEEGEENAEKHVQREGDGQPGKETEGTDFVGISPTSASISTRKKMEKGIQVQRSPEKPQQPENTEIKSTKEGEESVQREGDGQPGKDTEQTDFVGISPISVSTSSRKKEMEKGIQVQGRNEKPQQPENTELKSNKEREEREKHVQGEGDGQSGKGTERTDFVRIGPSSVSTSTKKKVEKGRQVQGSNEKPQQPENTELKSTREGEKSVQREGDGRPGKDTEGTDFVGISPTSASTSIGKKMEKGIQVQGRNEKLPQPDKTELKSTKEGEESVQREGDGQPGKDTEGTDFVGISPISASTSTRKKMEKGRQLQRSPEKPQQPENTELKSTKEGEESVQREGDGQPGKDTEGTDFVGISPTSVSTSTRMKMEKGIQVQGSHEKPQQPGNNESNKEGEENAEKHVQGEGDGQSDKDTEGTDFVGISPTSVSTYIGKKMEKGRQVQGRNEKLPQPDKTELKFTKEGEESVQRKGDGQPGKDTEGTDFVGISPTSASTSTRKKMEKGIQVQRSPEKPQQPENTELKSTKEGEESVQRKGDGQPGKDTERTDFVGISPISVSTSTRKKEMERGIQVQGRNEKPQQPENTDLKSNKEGEGREKHVRGEGDGQSGKDTDRTDFVRISPTSVSTSTKKKMERGRQVQESHEKPQQPENTELKSNEEGEESVQREGDGQPGKDTEGTDFVGISPTSVFTSTRKKMEKGKQVQGSNEKPQQPENTESYEEGEENAEKHVKREGDGQSGKDTEGTDFVGISPTSASTSTRKKMEKRIQVQGSNEKSQQPENTELKSTKEGEESVQRKGDGQPGKDTERTDFVGISPTSVSTPTRKKMEKGKQVQGSNGKPQQPGPTESNKEGEENAEKNVEREGDGQSGKDTERTDFVGISPTSVFTSTRKKMEKGIQVQRSHEKPQQPENTESTKEGEEDAGKHVQRGDGQSGQATEGTDFVGISPTSVSTSTRKKMEKGKQVQGSQEKPQQPENPESYEEGDENAEKHVEREGDGQPGKEPEGTDFVGISPTSVSTSTKKKMERGRQVQESHEKPQQPENTELKSNEEGEESVQREGDGQPGKDTEGTDFVGISPTSVFTSTRKKMEKGKQVQGSNEKPQQPENTESYEEGEENAEKHVKREGDGQSGKDTEGTDFVGISPTSASTSTRKKMEKRIQVQGSNEKSQQPENTELKSTKEGEESVQRKGDGQPGKDTERTDFVGISPTSVSTPTRKKMEKGKQVQGSNGKPQQPGPTESNKEGEENAEKNVEREGDGQSGKDTERTDFVGISPTSVFTSTRKKMEKGIQVQRSHEKPQQPENTESTKEGEEDAGKHVQRGDGQSGQATEGTDFVGISPTSVSTSTRKKMEKGKQVQGSQEKPQQPENPESYEEGDENAEKHVEREGDGQPGKEPEGTDFVGISPTSVSISTKKKMEKGIQVQRSHEKPQQSENPESYEEGEEDAEKHVEKEGDGQSGEDTERTDFVTISPTSVSTSTRKKFEKGRQLQRSPEKPQQPENTELKSTKEEEESVQREGDGQPGKDTEGTDFVGISPTPVFTTTRKKIEKGIQVQRSHEKPQQPENTESTKEGEEDAEEHVRGEGDGQPGEDTERTDLVTISLTSVSTSTRNKMERGKQVQGRNEKLPQPENTELKSTKEGEESVQREGDGQPGRDTERTDFVGISPTSVSTSTRKKMEKGIQLQGSNEKPQQRENPESNKDGKEDAEEHMQTKGDGQSGKDTEGTDFVGISPTSVSTSTRKKTEKRIKVQGSNEKQQQPENTELKSTKEGEESVQRKGDGQPGKDTEGTDFVGISPTSASTSAKKKMEKGRQVQRSHEKPQQPENTESYKEGEENAEKHVEREGDGQSGKDTEGTDFVGISPTSVSTSTRKKMEKGIQMQRSPEKPQQPENTEIKSTKEGKESVQREGDGQPGKDTEGTDFVGISPTSVFTSTGKKTEKRMQVQGSNEKPQQSENTESNKEGEEYAEKHVEREGDGQPGEDTEGTDFVGISPTSASISTRKKMEKGIQVQRSPEKPQQPENTVIKSTKEGEESVQREGDGQPGKDTERTDFVGISLTSVSTFHYIQFIDPRETESASVAPNLTGVSKPVSTTASILPDNPRKDVPSTTTFISRHDPLATISPEATGHSRWPAKPAVKHLKPKPGGKHKSSLDKSKDSKHDRIPDIKPKQEQKLKNKPGNDMKRIQIQRPGHRTDNRTSDQNLKIQKPINVQNRTTQPHRVPTGADYQRPATGKEPDPPMWNKNSKPQKRPVQPKPKPDKKPKSDTKDKSNQHLASKPEADSGKISGGKESIHPESYSESDDPPGPKSMANPNQRLKPSQKLFHYIAKQVPRPNQKQPKSDMKLKAGPGLQPNQEPRSNVTLELDRQSGYDQSPATQPKGERPPSRPTVDPGTATPKPHYPIDQTVDPQSTSSPVQQRTNMTHSPEFKRGTVDPNPVHPVSPNSKPAFDLTPQTTSQPPSIPRSTTPVTHQRAIPNTNPASSGPKSTLRHSAEEQAALQTISISTTPALQTISISTTPAPGTNPDLLAPGGESSTSSARELRVKINQVVAAFFNLSLGPKELPEDQESGLRTAGGSPLLTPSQGAVSTGRDCSDLLPQAAGKSGVYRVTPDVRHGGFPVFCDMELGGGGWTLLQLRRDGSVSFNRTWAEYRAGFGDLLRGGEFWLGNQHIHLLTRDRDMTLRVELRDFAGAAGYAEYERFKVASERTRYRLTAGGYSGTAGDALVFSASYNHSNRAFTTPDRDNDRYPSGNCGAYYSSGWWFDACMAANLNGRYYLGKYKGVRDGIYWGTWHNISTELYPTNERRSFKTVRMMIRPKDFTP